MFAGPLKGDRSFEQPYNSIVVDINIEASYWPVEHMVGSIWAIWEFLEFLTINKNLEGIVRMPQSIVAFRDGDGPRRTR